MPTVPPDPGGGDNAATIISQEESDELAGGTTLTRTVEVGAVSIPSGVYFQFRLPKTGYTRAVGQSYANGFGLLIEGILVEPNVVAIAYQQDVNQAGHLLDQLDIFWQTDDGSAAGDIVLPMFPLTDDQVGPAVQAAMAPYL